MSSKTRHGRSHLKQKARREGAAGRIRVVHVGRQVYIPYAALVAYVRLLCDEQGVPLDDLAMAG